VQFRFIIDVHPASVVYSEQVFRHVEVVALTHAVPAEFKTQYCAPTIGNNAMRTESISNKYKLCPT